jgi:hypothetical protein
MTALTTIGAACHSSFDSLLVPQLKLRHLHWLMFVQFMVDLHSSVLQMLHFLSHGDAAPVIKTLEHLDDTDQDNVAYSCAAVSA